MLLIITVVIALFSTFAGALTYAQLATRGLQAPGAR